MHFIPLTFSKEFLYCAIYRNHRSILKTPENMKLLSEEWARDFAFPISSGTLLTVSPPHEVITHMHVSFTSLVHELS
jgi:hypothetical protein